LSRRKFADNNFTTRIRDLVNTIEERTVAISELTDVLINVYVTSAHESDQLEKGSKSPIPHGSGEIKLEKVQITDAYEPSLAWYAPPETDSSAIEALKNLANPSRGDTTLRESGWAIPSSMDHNFHYTDILEDEIRLLTLLPALSVEDPLECKLTVLTRNSAPEYEAISYVWGEDDGKYTQLRVLPSEDQIPSNRYFFIRPNLVSALQREYHFTLLWTPNSDILKASVTAQRSGYCGQTPSVSTSLVRQRRVSKSR
jgi:hypothetical protein